MSPVWWAACLAALAVALLVPHPAGDLRRLRPEGARPRLLRRQQSSLLIAVDQQTMYLQQQRRRRGQTELTGHRSTVRAADPHPNDMPRTDADRPGIAEAVAGAGLPGQQRTLHQFGARVAIRSCLPGEDTSHDPGRPRRQQAPLVQSVLRL